LNRNILWIFILAGLVTQAQNDSLALQELEEVYLSGQRITLPFKEESRTITVITALRV